VDQLEREGFATDDLLKEGLEKGVPEGVLKLRIVEKLGERFNYNEVLLENGVLIIQTTPDMWLCSAPPSPPFSVGEPKSTYVSGAMDQHFSSLT
jgi:hypothetical protein